MNAHTVAKRLRGARYGLILGRSERFSLPRRMWLGHLAVVSFPENDPGVRTAFAEVLLSDTYGLDRRRGSFSTVLDIGANVGIFVLAARRRDRNAVIHAYEPNEALEPYLSTQVRAADATWFREAVAGRGGEATLIVDSASSVLSRIDASPGGVPVVSLATAVDRLGDVDFAKIDCEGSEWEMFDDPDPWQRISELALEYHLSDGRSMMTLGIVSGRLDSIRGLSSRDLRQE